MHSANHLDAKDGNECNLRGVRRWVGGSERWLRAFLKDIAADENIISVVAMGSAVRDRGHRRSDFDLLIIFREKRPLIVAPIEVDVRLYSAGTVEEKLANGNEIVGWAVKFGRPLHDKDRFWQSLYEKWKDRVPLPFASEAVERARKSLKAVVEMLNLGDDSAAEDLLLASATQLVRAKLIDHGVYPASRPELPAQLEAVCPGDPLADLLDASMYGDIAASDLYDQIKAIIK